MTEQLSASLVLDLKGLLCPIPVVRISQAIRSLPPGAVIEATATDPGVLVDIPAWCRSTGNELVSIERRDRLVLFRVKKVA